MKHLLTAYLAMTLLSGVVSVLVLLILRSKIRKPSLVYFSIVSACLTLSALQSLINFYLGTNITREVSYEFFLWVMICSPIGFVMGACIVLLAHELIEASWKRIGNIVAVLLSSALFLLNMTPLGTVYSAENRSIELGIFSIVGNISQFAIILYAVILAAVFHKRLPDNLKRPILALIALTAIFVPGFWHDQTYFASVRKIDEVPVTLIYFPAYFILMSCGTIWLGIRAILNLSAKAKVPDPVSAERRVDLLGRRLGLSDRERQVTLMVVEGLGNKQIAQSLGISVKTVNNHVYNLFQKIGINSRFELMALIAKEDEEEGSAPAGS